MISDLPSSEKQWLERNRVFVCAPLVSEGELIALGFGHAAGPLTHLEDVQLEEIHHWTLGASRSWRHFVEDRNEELHKAAAYRSQQLTTAGQVAATVAHEVRNPLAAVRSIVQLVKDTSPSPDRQVRMLSDVIDEVDRIDGAVSGLLGLARQHESTALNCDLGTMTADTVRFMESAAQRKRLRLTLDAGITASIWIDPREFRQIMLNVLLNAFEACEPGASIDVSLKRRRLDSSEFVVVEVKDTGAGIEPAILSRIFEPFFTTKAAGSGLGLAVTREILRKHGGDIRIESSLGFGTLVALEFPATS